MSVAPGIFGWSRILRLSRWLRDLTLSLLVIFTLHNPVSAGDASQRLFIQIWWDSPSVEVDPAGDPGRVEIYVGETFVGCAIAPSHMNYRKQLMIVPPSLGFTAHGSAAEVKVLVTGQLSTLAGRQVKISQIVAESHRPPS